MQQQLIDWQKFRDRHEGESAWLVCGGPSVRGFDFSQLGDTIAAINEIGRDIDNLSLWIGNDRLPEYPRDFWGRDCAKFLRQEQLTLPDCEIRNLHLFRSESQKITNSVPIKERLFFDPDVVLWGAPAMTRECKATIKKSVMLMALGVLYRMGFSEVRLLGCDWEQTHGNPYGHDHKEIDETVIRKSNEHFGFMEQWYRQLRPMFERRGFYVLNCTDGGYLEAFDRADWRDYASRLNSLNR